jgi:hypothetical protein
MLPSGMFSGEALMESAELEAFRTEFGDRLGALEVKVDAILAGLEEIKLKLGIRPTPTIAPAPKPRLRDGAVPRLRTSR